MKTRITTVAIAALVAGLLSASGWAAPPPPRGAPGPGARGPAPAYHYPRAYPHHHNHSGANVFLGATLGFALGAALAPRPYGYYAPRAYYYGDGYVYGPPPPVAYRAPAAVVYREVPANACLQTREYTATVTIDGRAVEAWGTRCLRPDGTWSYGPVQIADQ